jgi:plasmid stabilization system protein ParE
MSRTLSIELGAREDIAEAAVWYESREDGLGAEFLRAVERALGIIRSDPYQYQIIRKRGQVRRVVLTPFPYGLIYVASEERVVVVACTHGHRHPKHWQSRMR